MPSETYIGLIVPISNAKHNKENIHLSLREKTMSDTDYVKKKQLILVTHCNIRITY